MAPKRTTKADRKPLTNEVARDTAAPPTGYRLINDGGPDAARGLALRITQPTAAEPRGARAWVFRYTAAGRERSYTIGRVEDWKVRAARDKAKELRRIVDDGGDPLGERQDARAAETVNELAARHEEEHLPRLRPGSRRDAVGILRKWIRPALGNLKVAEVNYADVDRLHRKITSHGSGVQANRAVSLLSKMFNLAIRWKMRETNPAKGVDRNVEAPRQRYLTPDELERLVAALGERKKGDVSAYAVRLLLLTGARRGEVLSSTWSQFDLGTGVWTKPSSHTKQKREHRVPPSAPARQLLAEMREREVARAEEDERDPSEFVFPGHGTDAAQRDLKKFWAAICREARIKGVRVHDLRHSYASTLAGQGMSLPIIGALLGHTQAATTQRYAHLADAALRAATERVGAVVVAAGDGGKGGAQVDDHPRRGRVRR